MRITSLRCTPVRVPRRQPFTSSLGIAAFSENAVVEVETEEGEIGIGEVSSIWGRRGVGESEVVNDILAPALVGKDPRQINRMTALMDAAKSEAEPAKAGVEMALWDLLGRSLGVPVYALLGGLVRERLALSHSLSMGPSHQVVAEAERLVQKGYRTLKIKVGQDADADFETVRLVRECVGDEVKIRIDANMGWGSIDEAMQNIQALESFNLELVEQPLGRADLKGLGEIRKRVKVPIMADESVWTTRDAIDCLANSAANVFNVYVSEAGGLGPAAGIFAIAEAAGLPCIIGSMPELGIGTAAHAHLAFAMRNIGFACDVNGVVYHADDVIRETLNIQDGWMLPPDGPGLGVTLDREKVDKYRVG